MLSRLEYLLQAQKTETDPLSLAAIKIETYTVSMIVADLLEAYTPPPRRIHVWNYKTKRRLKLFNLRALKFFGIQVMRKDYTDPFLEVLYKERLEIPKNV